MNFQLTSVTGKINDKDSIVIFMHANGKTFNCVNSIECFKDAETTEMTLYALIPELIRNCYDTKDLK